MNKHNETLDTWNKVAILYEEKFMDLDVYNESYDFVCDTIIKDNAALLEIGCGPGNITKYLLLKRPDFNIYGIDFAPNMISLAQKNNPTASFNVMNSSEISTLNITFDGIICGFCLPYVSAIESKKLILDTYNLLNNKGLIYISFVEGEVSKSGFISGSSGDRTYFYYHNLEEIKTQLITNKFEILKTIKVEYKKSETENDIHTIVIATKKQ